MKKYKMYKHFGETGVNFRNRMVNSEVDIFGEELTEEEFEEKISDYYISCVYCGYECNRGPKEPQCCPKCGWKSDNTH